MTEEKPITATKPQKVPKKRGRKGTRIIDAFRKVPSTPVNAEEFAKENDVSLSVLRQAGRFDKTGYGGRVKVRKNRTTGELMIWREDAFIGDDMREQYWLAELDQYGNPKLIDGAHSNKDGAEHALELYKQLGGCNNGTKYAIAHVTLSEPTGHFVDPETVKMLEHIQRTKMIIHHHGR